MHLSLQRVLEVWNKDQQVMSEMTELNRIGISSNTQDNIIDRYTYKIKKKNRMVYTYTNTLLWGIKVKMQTSEAS